MSHEPVPEPNSLPFLGHTISFARDSRSFYEDVTSTQNDVVKVRILGIGDIYVLSDPDLVQLLLAEKRDEFRRPEKLESALEDLIGSGLLVSEGEAWERQRSMIEPLLSRESSLEFAGAMTDRAEQLVESYEPGDRLDVYDEMNRVALDVLVRAMFGTNFDYEEVRLRRMVNHLEEPGKPTKQPIAMTVPKWVPIPMWRRYRNARDHFEAVLTDLVESHRRGTASEDALLSDLVDARTDTDLARSDAQIYDDLMTLFFAGHQTTGTALTFVWYLLDENPDAAERLHDELDDVLEGRTPTVEDLSDLEYLDAVIRETLRLYPPLPKLTLQAQGTVWFDDYKFPEGSLVQAPQWALHRDERFWEDPEAFRPERWLEGADHHRFAYFPFGAGERRCVGEIFAMIESKLVIATIANSRRFEFEVDEPSVSISFTLLPRDDFDAVVRSR